MTTTVGDQARLLTAGDGALVVEFGDCVDRAVAARVMRTAALTRERAFAGVSELVPTFRSLAVFYDPLTARFDDLARAIAALPLDNVEARAVARIHTIPVLYGGEGGPDLEAVAETAGLSQEAVVAAHCEPTYFVYMLGFLPGFAYLGEVAEALRLPRHKNPRVRVPPGSVAIANEMATVYTQASPGGWHLLGHTPIPFFDASAEVPARLAPGDGVRFAAVSQEEHDAIARACAEGRYQGDVEECAP